MGGLDGGFAGNHDEVAVGETGRGDSGGLRELAAIVAEVLLVGGDGELGLDEEGEGGNCGCGGYFDERDCAAVAHYG